MITVTGENLGQVRRQLDLPEKPRGLSMIITPRFDPSEPWGRALLPGCIIDARQFIAGQEVPAVAKDIEEAIQILQGLLLEYEKQRKENEGDAAPSSHPA